MNPGWETAVDIITKEVMNEMRHTTFGSNQMSFNLELKKCLDQLKADVLELSPYEEDSA